MMHVFRLALKEQFSVLMGSSVLWTPSQKSSLWSLPRKRYIKSDYPLALYAFKIQVSDYFNIRLKK